MPDRRVGSGNISTRCSSMKRSGSGVHVFQLAFEHTEGILNTYFSYVWYLYRRTLRQAYVCAVAYSGHFCFGGDLNKPSITIPSVDRFYLNLVICLQLDIALLVQNSVKIWHRLSELWQCILGVTFFVDTVYTTDRSIEGHVKLQRWKGQTELRIADRTIFLLCFQDLNLVVWLFALFLIWDWEACNFLG